MTLQKEDRKVLVGLLKAQIEGQHELWKNSGEKSFDYIQEMIREAGYILICEQRGISGTRIILQKL